MSTITPSNADADTLAAVKPNPKTAATFAERATFTPYAAEHVPPGLGEAAHAEAARLAQAVTEAKRAIVDAKSALHTAERQHEADTTASVANGTPAPARASLEDAATALADATDALAATRKLLGEAAGRLHTLMQAYRSEFFATLTDRLDAVLDDIESGVVTQVEGADVLGGLLSGAERYRRLDGGTNALLIGISATPIVLPPHAAADTAAVLRATVHDLAKRPLAEFQREVRNAATRAATDARTKATEAEWHAAHGR